MKKIKKAVSVLLSLVLALSVFAIAPATASAVSENTEYIDADGNQQTVSANVLTEVNTLAAGWYVANGPLNFSDTITLTRNGSNKDVNIILTDNARIILNGQLYGFYSDANDESVNLNIYSQTANGNGVIESNTTEFISLMAEGSSLNVYGGNLTASEGINYASLISTGDIKNCGGSVENASVQSYDGAVTLNGGTLNVPLIEASTALYINAGNVITGETICDNGDIVFNLTDPADSFCSGSYTDKVKTE